MAKGLNVRGLMNVQFAIQDDVVFVLEVNPRASRTVPFVSKATGLQLAKIAARCMVGQSLASQGFNKEVIRTTSRSRKPFSRSPSSAAWTPFSARK
jgi:carbamoyl-phosphate synthase large subunit